MLTKGTFSKDLILVLILLALLPVTVYVALQTTQTRQKAASRDPQVQALQSDSSIKYSCPLSRSDITGIMQWNDGFPMNRYGRATHSSGIWEAIDINGYFGSPVKASVDGVIEWLENNDSSLVPGGYAVTIKGDDKRYYETRHLQGKYEDFNLSEGMRVKAGQVIGKLYEKGYSQTRPCDLSQSETAEFGACTKIHIHYTVSTKSDVYSQNPTAAHTLQFLRNQCGIGRPAGDNPEFPVLPTINCVKVTGNANIQRCFMERTPVPSPTQCAQVSVSNAVAQKLVQESAQHPSGYISITWSLTNQSSVKEQKISRKLPDGRVEFITMLSPSLHEYRDDSVPVNTDISYQIETVPKDGFSFCSESQVSALSNVQSVYDPQGVFENAVGGSVCKVVGWARDQDIPADEVLIRVFEDIANNGIPQETALVGTGGANIFRSDLESLFGTSYGRHGFEIAINNRLKDNANHTLIVQIENKAGTKGSNIVLPTKKTINCNRDLPNAQLSLSSTSGSANRGEYCYYNVNFSFERNPDMKIEFNQSFDSLGWRAWCTNGCIGWQSPVNNKTIASTNTSFRILSGTTAVAGPVSFTCTERVSTENSKITIYAKGSGLDGIYPTMQLLINEAPMQTWSNVGKNERGYEAYQKIIPADVSIKQIRVAFTNDAYRSPADRNLTVQKVVIEKSGSVNEYYPTSSNVYSKGVWSSQNGCAEGYKPSNLLACNGYFSWK